MTTLFRIGALVLVAGMLLGDIVVASVGLVVVCSLAVYNTLEQDKDTDHPQPSEFLA